MIIIQIKWLTVNSITLDYSFWIKVGQTFLNLFIGSNRVIVGSESSIVCTDIYFFVQHSTILFQRSVATLFQYMFVESFTAEFKFTRDDVIATVCLTTQTYYLRTFELFFEEARLPLIMLFFFYKTCSAEEICYSISSKAINTVI